MIVRRPFWLAWTAFLLLGAAWAVALPVNGTYDESAHIARAYAIYSGQWRPTGDLRIPASLLPTNADCTWAPRPKRSPASCQHWVRGRRLVPAPDGASRYPPLYYVLVGAPIRLVPDYSGVIASRLLSVAGSALLLAAAVAVALGLGLPLLAAATALAVTPMVVNLIVAVNPNGMEISAAILLFVALLSLVRQPEDASATPPFRPPSLLGLAGVAAFLLLVLRPLGPVLLAVDLLAVALVVGPKRLATVLLRRDGRVRFVGPVAAAAVLACVSLLVTGSPASDVPRGPLPPLSTGEVLDGIATSRIPIYVEQLVGRFSYGETRISQWAILLWYGLSAVAIGLGLWRGSRRARLVAAGLVVAALALLVGLELSFVPRGRWYAQGRYALPILVGVVLVAGWAAPRVSWQVPAGLLVATAPVHLYALARVMVRFESGGDAGVTSLGQGTWRPPAGPIAPLACVAVGVLLLLATVLTRRAVS